MARDLATNTEKARSVVSAGGLIVEVLGIERMASRMDLDAWMISSNVTITTVRDPDGYYPQSQRALANREWSYVVDLRTMKIVYSVFGSYGGGKASVDALDLAIMDILARLQAG